MTTMIEAVKRWNTRRTLEAQIASLKEERAPLSGHARGKVTRRITPLEKAVDEINAELADITPPMHPSKVLKKLQWFIGQFYGEADLAESNFNSRARTMGVEEAISRYGRDVLQKKAVVKMLSRNVLNSDKDWHDPRAYWGKMTETTLQIMERVRGMSDSLMDWGRAYRNACQLEEFKGLNAYLSRWRNQESSFKLWLDALDAFERYEAECAEAFEDPRDLAPWLYPDEAINQARARAPSRAGALEV